MFSTIGGATGTVVRTEHIAAEAAAPSEDEKVAAFEALKTAFEAKFIALTAQGPAAPEKISELARALRMVIDSYQRAMNRSGGDHMIGWGRDLTDIDAARLLARLLYAPTEESDRTERAHLQTLCHHTKRNKDGTKTNWFGTNLTSRADRLMKKVDDWEKEAVMRSAAHTTLRRQAPELTEAQIASANALMDLVASRGGPEAALRSPHSRMVSEHRPITSSSDSCHIRDVKLHRSQVVFLSAVEQWRTLGSPRDAAPAAAG